jgi:hypothetical protein
MTVTAVYLDWAVRQLRAQGTTVPDELLAHVAPLGWEHIGLTGDYVWTAFGPRRAVSAAEQISDEPLRLMLAHERGGADLVVGSSFLRA